MAKPKPPMKKSPSFSRPVRVAEEIQHILSQIFIRESLPDPVLWAHTITVSQVRVAPDLRTAHVYVMPFGGQGDQQEIIDALNNSTAHIHHLLAKQIRLKYIPVLTFHLDTSFDHAQKITDLLHGKKT